MYVLFLLPSLLPPYKACNGLFTVGFRALEESRLAAQAPVNQLWGLQGYFHISLRSCPSSPARHHNVLWEAMFFQGQKLHMRFSLSFCKLPWTAVTTRLPLS